MECQMERYSRPSRIVNKFRKCNDIQSQHTRLALLTDAIPAYAASQVIDLPQCLTYYLG